MRNVIVTGGTRGLGLSISRTLALSGYQVLVVARRCSSEFTEARDMVARSDSGSLRFLSCDLSETGRLSEFVKSLRRENGHIYGLVNNAGIGTPGLASLVQDEEVERLVRLNVTAPIIFTKHVLRSMMLQGEGRIINISSIVGMTGYTGLSAYSASKAALNGFTKALAREVGPAGITVNAVAPGFVPTDMTDGFNGSERAKIERRSALRRLVEPQDVANFVSFLMSDKARNITGAILTVDAGATT